MNKAFTKESDGEDEDDTVDTPEPLPPGLKNYITPEGLARLQEELKQLRAVERPKVVEVVSWAAGNGDRSENGDYIYGKKRLREIDRRLRYLVKRIEVAEVVDPTRQRNREQVFFGASVTYVDSRKQEHRVRIVGVDEIRHEQGEVSWVSPVGRALLRAYEGDKVEVRTPAGPETVEIMKIEYEA
ncbi:MAG: transcription elongation factor GreB [Kiloniellales bacterium]